jgi:hypothetical protein
VHDEAFNCALLLQRAPTLLEPVRAAEHVFRLVADGHLELDPATAMELLPAMQTTLKLLEQSPPSIEVVDEVAVPPELKRVTLKLSLSAMPAGLLGFIEVCSTEARSVSC